MGKGAQVLMLIMIALLWVSPAMAQSGTDSKATTYLQANGPQKVENLAPYWFYYQDHSWQKTIEQLVSDGTEKFAPIQTPTPNFGFTDKKIWLRLNVENTTQDVDNWVLYTHENFLQYYDVYIARDGGAIEHIESHTPETKFSGRSIEFPELVTEFSFAPSEKISIYIAYWSGGSSNISLTLETKESFHAKSIAQTSKNYVSYGMMLILIVASFLALVLLRLRVVYSYLTYVVVTLLFLMHADGVTFQFLWPHYPGFNSIFSIIIGLAFAVVPYDFARVFLRTKEYHPRTDKFMVFMIILTPVFIIPVAFIDPQFTKQILMLMVFFGILAGTLAGFVAALTRFKEVRFYLFAWIFGVASAGLMNMRHFLGIDIGQEVELDSIRIAIVIDAIMMGLGVADRYNQNLKASREADERNLWQARQNLRLNNRLFDLEEQYRLATELAASRDVELQNTVHDIRAPLHALRLNLQALESGESAATYDKSNIDETFSYLETLIADQLQKTIDEKDKPSFETGGAKAGKIRKDQGLNLSSVMSSVYEMFLPDAQEKGLKLRYVETSQQADIDPLVLMRIMTNLLSNAIKYTSAGKILMGVRRDGARLRVEIHDTGIGLAPDDFADAQERAVRLTSDPVEIDGHGFGLAIAKDLAGKHDLLLDISGKRKSGTTLMLSLPRDPGI